jgi:GNAT superfamily N-acetyltransferase
MIRIRPLEPADLAVIAEAFLAIGWGKPLELYARYLAEQEAGEREVRVAWLSDAFAGYVTLNWHPSYAGLASAGVPEVQDLNVLPSWRRRGVGAALLDAVERIAATRGKVVGLCVGVHADYGAAQRLYARRGYIPDGKGLVYHDRVVEHGEQVMVDHGLVLCFTKTL